VIRLTVVDLWKLIVIFEGRVADDLLVTAPTKEIAEGA
jgi:hypothetical protein